MENRPLPLFSVIVPVYNAEGTISKTIESILSQSYCNYELILVNDGSRDNSLSVCLDYKKRDSRVIVLDFPNGGVACARNRGIQNAKGEKICFVDADDIVLTDWLKRYSENSDADLMIEGHVSVTEKGKTYNSDDDELFIGERFIEGIEKVSRGGRLNMPWNKCYKREIIQENNLKFMEGCDLFEDLIFTLQYIQKATSLRLISYCGYEYLQVNSVLTRKFNEPDKFLMWINRIMDEALAVERKNMNSPLISYVFTRVFNAASWYVVLFFDRLTYSERNNIYLFLYNYKNYLRKHGLLQNRKLFKYVSGSNHILDKLIYVEFKLYNLMSCIRS